MLAGEVIAGCLADPIADSLEVPRALRDGYPLVSSIAFMGDSITGGVIGAAETGDRSRGGYPGWALACGLDGLELIRAAAGTNFQTGGYTAADINTTWLPAVITAAPDLCVVLSGANSLDDARAYSADTDAAAAWLFAQLVTTMTGLRDAGIKCVIGTITPDNYPTDASYPPAGGSWHPDFRTIRARVNALIRTQAATYGAVVWDAAKAYTTDTGDDTALADADYLTDEIHPNYTGCWVLGKSLADRMLERFRVGALEVPASGDPSWVSPNPYLTGDSSGLATGGWLLTKNGLTVNTSKDADGYQVLECTDGPDAGTNTSFQLSNYSQVTDDSYDGRRYRAIVELLIDEADAEFWLAEARITAQTFDSAPATRRAYHPLLHASLSIADSGALPPHTARLLFATDVIEHPGGAGADRRRLTVVLYLWGRGTARVKVAGIQQLL